MSADRQCLGCGQVGPWDSSGRCSLCRYSERPHYDHAHRMERARWARLLSDGCALDCPRCGQPIAPGDAWDLGHQSSAPSHPEHVRCNRGARRRPKPSPLAARALLAQLAKELRR